MSIGETDFLGRAIVRGLFERGAHVLVNSESAAACDRTARELEGSGGHATAFPSTWPRRRHCPFWPIQPGRSRSNRCDFLQRGNSGRKQPGEEGYETEVAAIFAINLHHSRRLCDLLLPRMASAGGGSAVLTASLAALRGNRNIGVYGLTKAAIVQLARDMAIR